MYELNKLEDIAIYMKSQHGNTVPPTNKTVALTEKSNGDANDKITDLEILAKLQTSESILGSRILHNVKEGD